MHPELVSLIVDDYDAAIDFFVDKLRFEMVEDSPSTTNDGRPKRWLVVRPPAARTGLLLAQADGDAQRAVVGRQHAGRVGFFLGVNDFDTEYVRLQTIGMHLLTAAPTATFPWVVASSGAASGAMASAPAVAATRGAHRWASPTAR